LYKKEHTTFTNIYRFKSDGKLGITNCFPLWSSPKDQHGTKDYYGAYCLDQYPTSDNNEFVQQYYQSSEEGHVDYLIFNEEDAFA